MVVCKLADEVRRLGCVSVAVGLRGDMVCSVVVTVAAVALGERERDDLTVFWCVLQGGLLGDRRP